MNLFVIRNEGFRRDVIRTAYVFQRNKAAFRECETHHTIAAVIRRFQTQASQQFRVIMKLNIRELHGGHRSSLIDPDQDLLILLACGEDLLAELHPLVAQNSVPELLQHFLKLFLCYV